MSAVVSPLSPSIRLMCAQDLAAVMAIERAAYEFPWTEPIFRDCMRAGYECYVYDSQQGVLGYGIMSLGAGECHLLNICIHADYRGQGFAARLIEELLMRARRKRTSLALLEVRVSNEIAYRLYTKLGFNEIGLRKNYYPARRGREDALVLARDLTVTTVGGVG